MYAIAMIENCITVSEDLQKFMQDFIHLLSKRGPGNRFLAEFNGRNLMVIMESNGLKSGFGVIWGPILKALNTAFCFEAQERKITAAEIGLALGEESTKLVQTIHDYANRQLNVRKDNAVRLREAKIRQAAAAQLALTGPDVEVPIHYDAL